MTSLPEPGSNIAAESNNNDNTTTVSNEQSHLLQQQQQQQDAHQYYNSYQHETTNDGNNNDNNENQLLELETATFDEDDDGYENSNNNDHGDCDSDDDDISLEHFDLAKERLLRREENFTISYDAGRGYRGTELQFFNFDRPHMRGLHASWICYFGTLFVQFSMAPLLPLIETSLNLTRRDIWLSNVWMMVGGIFTSFILGPLCDKYGSRRITTYLLALCGIPCALSGFLVYNLSSLVWFRFIIGAMDTFVPSQYWITCMFVREVAGTAMAITGGLGASGAAITQLAVGSIIFPLCLWVLETITINDHHFDDEAILMNWAWRISLFFPGVMVLFVAWYFYLNSDDCPLGNYEDVKRAGLMVERSAVDSFRSGVYNINSWILFLQYAGSFGVDCTMCNGTAMYFYTRFNQSVATSSVMAFLYGISATYARGWGGAFSDYMSEKMSLRGRLFAQFACMIVQGLLNVWFSRMASLVPSLVVMVIFSILVQMSMGTCFGVVPYVDGPNTGSVAGIVGAGGNAGAVVLGIIFMTTTDNGVGDSMEIMGWITVGLSLLTPLIVVKGYRGIFFGKEADDEDSELTKQYSPLITPANMMKGKNSNLSSPKLNKNRNKLLRNSNQKKGMTTTSTNNVNTKTTTAITPPGPPGKILRSPHLVSIKRTQIKQQHHHHQQLQSRCVIDSRTMILPKRSSTDDSAVPYHI